jgi:hypothetical protein
MKTPTAKMPAEAPAPDRPDRDESAKAGWAALECIRGAAVTATWQHHLGDTFGRFQTAFLLRLPGEADCVPCPRDCGCAHQVVRLGAEELIGVCRCESLRCDDVVLSRDDVALWGVSWPRLGAALCEALQLQAKRAELGLERTRQIGAWSSDAVPVILTLAGDRQGLLHVIAQLAARLRQPFILLAPTARHLDAVGQELLAGIAAGFFALATCLQFTDAGRLRPLRSPGELFARFSPQPKEELAEGTARQAFALVKALDSAQPALKASLYTVFRLFCMEGLTVEQVAERCRCARSLIFVRLAALRKKLGADPRSLRQYSDQFERIEDSLTDPRARRVYRKGAAYGEEAEEDKA